jgi:hypothetical protein
MRQLALRARDDPHELVWKNSPPAEMRRATAELPVLVTVTARVPLPVPTRWAPKSMLDGDTESETAEGDVEGVVGGGGDGDSEPEVPVPERSAVATASPPDTVRVPAWAPCEEGANVTLTVHFLPGSSAGPHPLAEKSPLAPAEILTGLSPVFWTVKPNEEAVPTCWFPKSCEGGERLIESAATAGGPVSKTAPATSATTSEIRRIPDR